MPTWQPIPEAADLPPNASTTITVNGTDIALCRDDQRYYALSNRCPHRQGQIGDGRVENGRAICPLHGWDFDLTTGVSPYDPNDRLDTYPLRQSTAPNGAVDVAIDADAVPPTPTSGFLRDYQGRWRRFTDDVESNYQTLHGFARYGRGAVESMRTTRPVPNFDDVLFRPGQLARLPLLQDEPVSLALQLGGSCERPLNLAMPLLISHMSFGALSAEAKVALARASAQAGIAIGSGEGGLLPAEREHADQYILEMASGYFGWTEDNIRQADAIEIKIGQAAKAGSGGLLPADKVTPEIAAVRGLPPGQAAHSPARFPDISTVQDLIRRVDEIRALNPGKPVGIKLAASKLEDDLDVALQAAPAALLAAPGLVFFLVVAIRFPSNRNKLAS